MADASSPFSLTESQATSINILLIITGTIGLSSSLYLFFFLFRNHRLFRNPSGRLIISIAFCDLVNVIFKLIGRSWIADAGSPCTFQAFMISQFALSEWILGTCLAVYTVLIVCYGKSINYFKKTESLVLAAAFLLPLPLSVTTVAMPNTIPIGDAQLYCWISSTSIYQLYLYTIPILAFCAINIYCISAVSVVSFKYGHTNVFGETVTYKKYLMIRFYGYQFLFWISYIPVLINRLGTTFAGRSIFPLLILQATISPLQGTFHMVILSYVWEFNPVRESEQQEYAEMNIVRDNSRANLPANQSLEMDLPSPHPLPLVERNIHTNVLDQNVLNIIQIGGPEEEDS